MATSKAKVPTEFDPAKLERLTEPLTVVVYKISGGQREPIVLPTKPEESVPGKGWMRDDILQLEEFLGKKWGGAGSYDVTVAGSNGETIRWKPYFPETRYPVLHEGQPISKPGSSQQQQQMPPSGLQGYAAPGVPQNAASWLGGLPFPAAQQQQMQPFSSPWGQFPGSNGHGGWLSGPFQAPASPWSAPASPWSRPPDQPSDRVQAEREERLKLEAKIERERLENAYKERLSGLGAELQSIKAAISEPRGESEEVKVLKEQLRRMEERSNEDKFSRMIEETNRQTRELIAQNQAQTLDLVRALQARIEQAPKGPDPTMMLVVETMRTQSQAQTEAAKAQVEAQKEIARLQAETQREAARNALGPREMIDLMRSSTVGQEQLASAYGKVWELMQMGLETIITAQGPASNPALELVGQAAQGGLEVAQRYVAMRERAAVAQAQATAATAQAQAQAAQAQAHAQAQAQLAGGEEEDEGDEGETFEEPAEVAREAERLFGPALPHVLELRAAVAEGMVNAQQTAQAILGGIEQLITNEVKVPVLDLWIQGKLLELVTATIPDAKESFREQTIGFLFQARQVIMEQQAQAQAGAGSPDVEAGG